jgi:hypothetical protein
MDTRLQHFSAAASVTITPTNDKATQVQSARRASNPAKNQTPKGSHARTYERALADAGVTRDDLALLRELSAQKTRHRGDRPALAPTRTFL